MAQLINLKQRIKAAETIKKITHAMRLVSMSNNLKLRSKKGSLDNFTQDIKKLWIAVNSQFIASAKSEIQAKPKKNLVIIVSSEKGLCGNFNNALFGFYNNHKKDDNNSDIIIVGKEGLIFLKQLEIEPIQSYPIFNSTNLKDISKKLSEFINSNKKRYKSVIVYSNWPKSFFIQKQKRTILFPITESLEKIEKPEAGEYIWSQDIQSLSKSLEEAIIFVNLSELLFDSLLSEQAARFISMDNATRNATNLINTMKLEYNKLRQAAITRELTELSST